MAEGREDHGKAPGLWWGEKDSTKHWKAQCSRPKGEWNTFRTGSSHSWEQEEVGAEKHGNEKKVNLLAAGLEVKYLIRLLCITGIRQQQRTTTLTAMIPKNNRILRNTPVHKKTMWVDDAWCVCYLSLFSVLLWGCPRSHLPWTSAGWAVAGSPTADSTIHASRPCPGSPGHTAELASIDACSLCFYERWRSQTELPVLSSLRLLTCNSFSASSSFADWTLDFRVSYCKMAAALKEQPVNWHGVN